MLFLLQGLRDARCHLLLFRTELEILSFRERAVLGKESMNPFYEFAAEVVFQCDHRCREQMTKEAQKPNGEQLLQLSFVILKICPSFELCHSDFGISSCCD